MKTYYKGSRPSRRVVPCMPPMLEEEKIPLINTDTGYGGSACENAIAMFLLSQKINCAQPTVDEGADLLVEKGDKWQKAQVKKIQYINQLDNRYSSRHGSKRYREMYGFKFQRSGGQGKQRTIDEIDVFYHTLFTCYRMLIWEIPASIVPLREDGKTFINIIRGTLDRSSSHKQKSSWIDLKKHLIYTRYDPIIFTKFPDFFGKKSNLESFYK